MSRRVVPYHASHLDGYEGIDTLRRRANGLELAVTLIQRGDPLWRIPGTEQT